VRVRTSVRACHRITDRSLPGFSHCASYLCRKARLGKRGTLSRASVPPQKGQKEEHNP